MIITGIILAVAAFIAYLRWGHGIGTKSVTLVVPPPKPPVTAVPASPTPITTPVVTPPTSPTPAPAPAVSPRSYGWVWWAIIIIAIVFVGRWIWYEGRSVRNTYSPPRATAPEREIRQKFNLNVDLPTALDKEQSRISVARIVDGTPSVSVGKGGKAFFQLGPLPKATLALFLSYTLVDGKSGYVTVAVNGVEHSNIYFTPEGCGMLFKIPEAMVKEKNTIAIAPNSAMQIKRLWLKESQQ